MKTYPSKKTQQDMFDFFMRTSAPRLLKKAKEKEKEEVEGKNITPPAPRNRSSV